MSNPSALPKRRGATIFEKREARRRLREELDAQLAEGKHPDEAAEAALKVVEAEYAAAGVDWVSLLPFLMEFIMMLLEMFRKPSGS